MRPDDALAVLAPLLGASFCFNLALLLGWLSHRRQAREQRQEADRQRERRRQEWRRNEEVERALRAERDSLRYERDVLRGEVLMLRSMVDDEDGEWWKRGGMPYGEPDA